MRKPVLVLLVLLACGMCVREMGAAPSPAPLLSVAGQGALGQTGGICTGGDVTHRNVDTCSGVTVLGTNAYDGHLVFEDVLGAFSTLVADHLLEGRYAGGKVETFGASEEAEFRVLDEDGWVFEQKSSGLVLVQGDTGGTLALGDSTGSVVNAGATLQAFAPDAEDGPWARLHLEADGTGPTIAEFGIHNVVSNEPVLEGLSISVDPDGSEMRAGNATGAGIRFDENGNIIVRLGS